jgi:hypothetical protein
MGRGSRIRKADDWIYRYSGQPLGIYQLKAFDRVQLALLRSIPVGFGAGKSRALNSKSWLTRQGIRRELHEHAPG